MIKTLMGSIRDYIKVTVATPLLVLGEVLSEPKPGVWFDAGAPLPREGAVHLDRRTRMIYDKRHVFINGESFRAAGRDAKLMQALADAKGEIFQGLEPGGTAVIPFDSPHRDRLIGHAKPYAANILTFGSGEGADVRALDAIPSANGTMVTARLPEAELAFTLSQPGAHWVSNALAVLAAVDALGGDLAAAGLALADFGGLEGRGAHHRIRIGGGEALVIDESYNANPTSMAATLEVLGNAAAARRIVVLGAMRELGQDSDALHAGLAGPVLAANVDYALLVGSGMEPLAKALEGKIDSAHWPDASSAGESLQKLIRPGDAILIKGSNAIGLGRIVTTLTGGQN